MKIAAGTGEEQADLTAAPGWSGISVSREHLANRARAITADAIRGENSGLLMLIMALIVAIFAIVLRETSFLGVSNMVSIVGTTTSITVMAVATVFVLCCGEIDLSFAAVVAVSGYIAALLIGHGIVLASVAALLFGAAVGWINGMVTMKFRIPSFVVTLGSMGILQGVAAGMTGSATLTVSDQTFLNFYGQGNIGPIPILMAWSLAAVIVGGVILNYTSVGRHVLATGANVDAARYSGIRTGRVKVGVLTASGVAGALAGLLYVGQYTAATYSLGSTDLLTVLAAVIIGGTALTGGKGSVVGALIGSFLLGLLNNALVIIGLAAPGVLIARGAIIVFAVILSSRGSRRRR
ncbi:MAG TPA: ABC transporter permease [Streptosporangiaceae bacterium]|nr:ABC transporter permease [Streptosporangiaceae bacterium]